MLQLSTNKKESSIYFESFKDCIDFYYENRKTEYEIKYVQTPHNGMFHLQGLASVIKKYDNHSSKLVVEPIAIERFHPNYINNKEFWCYAKKKFPKFSVCGIKSKNIKDCNERTFRLPEQVGFIGFINDLISKSTEKLNVLEIGYGHGNVFEYLNDKTNYVGIDYTKLKKLDKFKNLMVIDKSGIPDTIKPNTQDFIYSVNVLQHCSQQDRFEYFKQSYEKLKTGGYFIGSCLIHCDENKDLSVWGIQDEYGRHFCNFFNQLTEVDTLNEFIDLMRELKFDIYKWGMKDNNFFFILKK